MGLSRGMLGMERYPAAVGRVLTRVVQEIVQDSLKLACITEHPQAGIQFGFDSDVAVAGGGLEPAQTAGGKLFEIDRHPLEDDLTGIELRKIEEILHDRKDAFRLFVDNAAQLDDLLRRVCLAVAERLCKTQYRRKRGFEVM